MFRRHGVPQSRLDFLREVPLFDGLSDKVLAKIDAQLDELHVQAGRELTTQGRGSYEIFIVADGLAEVRVDDQPVGETTVGDLIGEVGVLENRLRTATVVAKTPMTLLVTSSQQVAWLFDDETLAARVKQNHERHTAGPQPD